MKTSSERRASTCLRVSLFTIGYQGRSLEAFLDVLANNAIDVLLDIRRTPWSHKPGFRKARLAEAVVGRAIEYVHRPELGSDRELRQRLRDTADFGEFAHAYRNRLIEHFEAIEATFVNLRGQRVCLLCLEANPDECHRSVLADHLVGSGIAEAPVHL